MKLKVIKAKDYLLLIDEEAEIKKYYSYYLKDNKNVIKYMGDTNEPLEENEKVIIAYYPLTKEPKELDLLLLPNPFEENMLSLLNKNIPSCFSGVKGHEIEDYNKGHRESWIKGYKAAQSKQFSLEDIKRAIELARLRSTSLWETDPVIRFTEEEIIQSLSTQQLPKEFIPEYEYYYHSSKEFYADAGFIKCSKEQYEIIKKEIPTCPMKLEIKTITNSEGKQELVGTWKF